MGNFGRRAAMKKIDAGKPIRVIRREGLILVVEKYPSAQS
jgi:membrane-bound ClpP family serine protease